MTLEAGATALAIVVHVPPFALRSSRIDAIPLPESAAVQAILMGTVVRPAIVPDTQRGTRRHEDGRGGVLSEAGDAGGPPAAGVGQLVRLPDRARLGRVAGHADVAAPAMVRARHPRSRRTGPAPRR